MILFLVTTHCYTINCRLVRSVVLFSTCIDIYMECLEMAGFMENKQWMVEQSRIPLKL